VIADDYRVLQDRYIALHRGHRRLFPKVRLSAQAQEQYGLVDATAVFIHDHDAAGLAAARRLLIAARTRKAPEHLLRDALAALRAPAPVLRDVYRTSGRTRSRAVAGPRIRQTRKRRLRQRAARWPRTAVSSTSSETRTVKSAPAIRTREAGIRVAPRGKPTPRRDHRCPTPTETPHIPSRPGVRY